MTILLGLKCPQPEEHENSFVIPTSLSVGSTATYYCYHGFFPTVNSTMTITCQESGKWTELIGRCTRKQITYSFLPTILL